MEENDTAEVEQEPFGKMVDLELKAKWVEALRSGKYKQGERKLRTTDDGYCCLGVLCDIVSPEAWTLDESWPKSPMWVWMSPDKTGGTNRSTAFLPHELGNKLFGDYHGYTEIELADRNDDGQHTFAQIADFIEQNL